MFNEKQKLESGNDSTNYQSAGDITINHGMTYTEVKDVAMTVFKSNFVDLGLQVETLVNERAEKFITDYLNKLINENPEAIDNTKDPDIRYNIFEAQKSYARSGKEDVEELLVNLLYERTISNGYEFRNMVLNEALNIVSKVSKTQIEILVLIFLMNYVSYSEPRGVEYFEMLIALTTKLFQTQKDKQPDYFHLSSLGCLDISIGSVSFERLITSKNIIELNNNEELNNLIRDHPILRDLKTFWDNDSRKIQNSTPTPVGNAIAISYINQKLGKKMYDISLVI